EVMHLSNITNLLIFYNKIVIPPCNYSFLVNKTKELFKLTYTITSIRISATIRLNKHFIIMNLLLVRLISSILTVESWHDIFF
ncbi:hypothetical protein CC80DRAFT_432426, partial [Byssothecium circinans]